MADFEVCEVGTRAALGAAAELIRAYGELDHGEALDLLAAGKARWGRYAELVDRVRFAGAVAERLEGLATVPGVEHRQSPPEESRSA